tara:strand:- start:7678 stop:8397 length:720 start_codon:yes stop_codon:yes gene_type:complete
MAIQTRTVEYGQGENTYSGLLAWDDSVAGPRPGVLVAHTIRGRTAFEDNRARQLAELGYAGFALDVYGASNTGVSDEHSRAQMETLLADRGELQQRLLLSLATMQTQPEVDAACCAAIGFCFGGLSVIDLARLDANVKGVASFHGLLNAPGNIEVSNSKVKVLAMHGWDDPMAPPDAVLSFATEMSALDIDWQLHGYGNVQHAFTYPAANDTSRGTVYDAASDRRSWIAAQNFLAELFE